VHPDRIRAHPGYCQRACSPWIFGSVEVAPAGTPCGRENGAGCPPTPMRS
jgi:hypothetical protein